MFWFKKKQPLATRESQAPKIARTASVKPETISFDDFTKVDLRVGAIQDASRVEGSDKLLKLKVSFSSGDRQIIAGIGKAYAPENLVGKTAAFVFNLAPRKLMGLESQGMILAVSDDGDLSILSPDKSIKAGSRIT